MKMRLDLIPLSRKPLEPKQNLICAEKTISTYVMKLTPVLLRYRFNYLSKLGQQTREIFQNVSASFRYHQFRCKLKASEQTKITMNNLAITRNYNSQASTSIKLKTGVPSKQYTVAVEGNIGSGKTTLLEHFSQNSDVEIVAEPVNRWRSVQGHNLLNLMYQDPSRWSLTFQTYVQLTMLDIHTRQQVSPIRLLERSIYSARYCFVENLYKQKLMPEAEYIVLSEWFNWIIQNSDCHVDLIVYLQTHPEVVHERIKRRARPEEKTVSLEYLKILHELHENWLTQKSQFSLPAPVLILQADDDLQSMQKQFDYHSSKILCQTAVSS